MNVYDINNGTYKLYDAEGTYTIYHHKFQTYVKMTPKHNGTNYEHSLRFPTSVGFHTFSTAIKGKMPLTFECLSYYPIADKAGNGLYKVTLAAKAYPI